MAISAASPDCVSGPGLGNSNLGASEQEARQVGMIKILFLSANPRSTKRLRLDEEVRAIQDKLNAAELRDHFLLEQEWALRVGDLQGHLMRHKPNVVHFSGHGSDEGEIILEDPAGRRQAVPIPALEKLFGILKRKIPIACVVLNSCFSKAQAMAIAKHIECVVGMSRAIGDEAAVAFAAALYQALAFGHDIQTAFDLACVEVQLRGLGGHNVPELISRTGSNPAHIYITQKDAVERSRFSDPPKEGRVRHIPDSIKSAGPKDRRNRITTIAALSLVILSSIYLSWRSYHKSIVSGPQSSQEQPTVTPNGAVQTHLQRDSSLVKPARISPEGSRKAGENVRTYEVTLVIPSFMSKPEILVDSKPAFVIERDLSVVKIRVDAKAQPTMILVREGTKRCQSSILVNKDVELTPCA
jgi:hypothetical protein